MQGVPATRNSYWPQLKKMKHWSRRAQVAAMMLADVVVVIAALALAYFARFEGRVPAEFSVHMLPAAAFAVVVIVGALWFAGLYHIVLRYVGIQVMGRLGAAVAGSLVALVVLDTVLSGGLGAARAVPFGVVIFTTAFAFIGLAALRSVGRLWVVMTGAGTRASIAFSSSGRAMPDRSFSATSRRSLSLGMPLWATLTTPRRSTT